jgi:hypothetical protein
VWRASLAGPHTGEGIGFANLDALFAYLRQQMGIVSDSDGDEDEIGEEGEGRGE